MRGLTGALALWLAASGCGGGASLLDDGAHPPASHPAGPHAAVPAPQAAVPDPAAATTVSLDQLLAYADRHAPELAVAASTRARAAAARVEASPLFPDEPLVTVAAGPRRRSDGGRARWDVEVGLEQRVEIAGQRGARRAAADHTAGRVEAQIAAARWQVHQRVHLAFHAALVARERVGAAARLHGFSERLVEVASKRLGAGDISRLQVRVAEGELAIALEKKIAAEQEYLSARLTLAEVSGWPGSHPPAPAGALDPPREAPAAAALVELARARHPELVALRSAVEEAEAGRRAADRAAWPDLIL
ncbi:MAG TPA: TolC family protein, partial [Kofleriaceae bacterium]|nr:TolC family protein [Kofleriaceae bacterium]